MNKVTPAWVQTLKENDILVWSSKTAGRFGLTGKSSKSFIIPAKDKDRVENDLALIEIYIEGFFIHARKHPDKRFFVTELEKGFDKITTKDIAPFFIPALGMDNVWLPQVYYNLY